MESFTLIAWIGRIAELFYAALIQWLFGMPLGTYVMLKSTLWFRSCTRPSPASLGGLKVMYAVKKVERKTAWERGYVNNTPCCLTMGISNLIAYILKMAQQCAVNQVTQ